MGAWLAQLLGVFMGSVLKSAGPEGVAAFIEGVRRGMEDKAEKGRADHTDPDQQLVDKWLSEQNQTRASAAWECSDKP